MQQLPSYVQAYKKTPVFTEITVPKGLLKDHSTKADVWGVIHVLSGKLRYTVPSQSEVIELTSGDTAVVVPEQVHFVTPLGDVSFYADFWR